MPASPAQTPAPPATPPLNPAAIALIQRLGGPSLVRDLCGIYAGYAPTRLAEARRALAAGDADEVRRACHALKSGSAQLGVTAVATACAEAERRAMNGELEALAPVLDALDEALTVALPWLLGHVGREEAA